MTPEQRQQTRKTGLKLVLFLIALIVYSLIVIITRGDRPLPLAKDMTTFQRMQSR